MRFYARTHSERSEKGQGGDEFVCVDFFSKGGELIAQVELYVFDDKAEGYNINEWILKWRKSEDEDWDLLTQGHTE